MPVRCAASTFAHCASYVLISIKPATRWHVVWIDARPCRMSRFTTCYRQRIGIGCSPSPILDAHQLLFDLHQYCGDGLRIETTFQSSSETWQIERLGAPSSFRIQIPASGLKDCCRTHPSELPPVTCAACDAGHFIDPRIGAMLWPSAASPSECHQANSCVVPFPHGHAA
jgi:hypothetical protein